LTGFQGQAVAAGDNSHGQLGDGTSKARRTPVVVSGLGKSVTQVAAGAGFGVALTVDGTVWTWAVCRGNDGYRGSNAVGASVETRADFGPSFRSTVMRRR